MKLSWQRINLLLLVCSAVQFAAEGHIVAFTPLLLRELGLAEAEVAVWAGLLSATTTAAALPLGPFWGPLAERFGHRKIILRSYLFCTITLLLLAWAPSTPWLVFGRAVLGLSFGVGGVLIATQAHVTPRPQLGRAIATVQSAMPVAASLGPPLGALAIPALGIRGLFVVDAAAVGLASLAMFLLLPEPSASRRSGSVVGRVFEVFGLVGSIAPIRWNFLSGTIMRGGMSVIDAYLPVRIAEVAPDPALAIGWILGTYGALTTAATWWAGRLVDRFAETRLFWWAMVLGLLVAVGLAAATWLPLIALCAALRSIPIAFSNTVLFSHLARVVPPDQQTGIFGLVPTARNVGGLGSVLLAAGLAGLSPFAPLTLAAALFVVTLGAARRLAAATRS